MNAEILDLLREIAHFQSHEAALDKRLEWQQAAQEMLNNETDHLCEPPTDCPVCGAPVYQEYNARYHVIIVRCEACSYEDEWEPPETRNEAAIRY